LRPPFYHLYREKGERYLRVSEGGKGLTKTRRAELERAKKILQAKKEKGAF
jgi:hypothetical protein